MNKITYQLLEKVVDESQHYCSKPIDINNENITFLAEVLTEYVVHHCCKEIKHKSTELLDNDFADHYSARLKQIFLNKS